MVRSDRLGNVSKQVILVVGTGLYRSGNIEEKHFCPILFSYFL